MKIPAINPLISLCSSNSHCTLRPRLMVALLAMALSFTLSAQCPPGNLTINSQAELDAYVLAYPTCTKISGTLRIEGSNDITNLDQLSLITQIDANLLIQSNTELLNVDGLSNLTAFANTIRVLDNQKLTSVAGLENVNGAGEYRIQLNRMLTEATSPNLTAMGTIIIANNQNLVTFNGPENLADIYVPSLGINIESNPSLTTINGFGMLENDAANNIQVRNNTALQACDIELLCRQIAFGNSPTVTNNAPGCQSLQDATDQCNGVPIIINCPTQPIVLNADNNCEAATPDLASMLTVIDTDNSQAQLSFSSAPQIGAALSDGDMFTVTVTDLDAKTDDCVATVTLVDVTPPTVSIPSTANVNLGANGTATYFVPTPLFTITDNCVSGFNNFDKRYARDGGPVNNDPRFIVLDCNDLGTPVNGSVTVEESGGNETTETFVVTVFDVTSPQAVCQDLTVTLNEQGEGMLQALDFDNGSTDNCGIASRSLSKSMFTCDDVGANNVSLVVVDDSNNQNSASCTVTVQENATVSCQALPVTLTAFSGSIAGKNNILTWTAAQEDAFSHYEVERSANGTDAWATLGSAAGAMQAQQEQGYSYTDLAPLPFSYYRLRMVDLDGSSAYSPIVHLERAISGGELSVYPNPTAGQVTIKLPTEEGEQASLKLFDLSGKLLFQTKTTSSHFEQHLNISPGVYLLSAETASGKWTRRVVVR
ncbi:T9SS type A sorting domain-containing protein [Neolewinella aurantiaca]|uniref:T9SS type A sorting domain-containing protein n=1 Tax=Neolewinella aurantiaca TaxID=2602767 RepID=A0A5C7FMU6_9BACT|nr:T9SS type A sorting domain-containing protein [Neolewinella aurantiaca]TXF91462.1 T9SS type A sorting domain-containing protein [Neolewinella aurantiaca]